MIYSNLNQFFQKCKECNQYGIEIYIVGMGKAGTAIGKTLDENHIVWGGYVDKYRWNDKKIVYKKVLSYSEIKDKEAFLIISSNIYREGMKKDLCEIGVCDENSIAILSEDVYADLTSFKRFQYPYRGHRAMHYLLQNFDFVTVLDVGCGQGKQSEVFVKQGKKVTALDYGDSYYFKTRKDSTIDDKDVDLIIGDINKLEIQQNFDAVWCSHVLEHQLNPNQFLKKLNKLTKENGVLAITVPGTLDPRIQGGHVSVWNAGLLLYHLVLAGYDCSNAHILNDEADLSIVVKKKEISVLDALSYDRGDIKKIQQYLPINIEYMETIDDVHFNGDIKELNWQES